MRLSRLHLTWFMAAAVSLVLLPTRVHAQTEIAPPPAVAPNLAYEGSFASTGQSNVSLDPQRLYDTGTTMRNVGIGMTSVGAVLLPLSFYFAFRHGLFACGFYSDGCTAQERADIDRDGKIALGSLIGSAVTLGAGIPLWAVGVHRMRQAQRMGYSPVAVTPFVGPTTGGVVAGVTLTTF